jgi:hypothetical protein
MMVCQCKDGSHFALQVVAKENLLTSTMRRQQQHQGMAVWLVSCVFLSDKLIRGYGTVRTDCQLQCNFG